MTNKQQYTNLVDTLKIKYPSSFEEINEFGFSVFMRLGCSPISAEARIYTRHKETPGRVFVFIWDGIHYIKEMQVFTELSNKII